MSTTRTNLLPSPNDTAVVGAAAERFSNLGSGVGITVSAAQRGSRAVVRVTASAATTQLGVRTKLTLNSPNVSESTVFWFSADVFIPANVPGPNITVTFRDDPNNDSGTGIFDPSTPSARLLTDIARDTWVRLSWKATVKAGRTVTAVQMWTGATSHAAGIWWETSRWHVEASTSSVAPVWFDGDTGDDLIPPEIVIRDWTGVPKESTSTEVTSVPQISLAWVSTSGSVRFTVTDAIAGQTVKRLTPSNTLQGIRGYGDDSWISGGSGFGYDYEMELGVTVRYALVDKAATTLPAGASVASVFTQTPGRANGEAWLRDVMQPILSQPVSVISTGDERRVARQAVYDIAGKANPVVVWDSRTSRQGTVTLGVQNTPQTGVWATDTDRDKMDLLLSSGRPLLLSMCANLGFHPCYMAVADATYTRAGKGATWALQLDYVEVDNPTALGVYPVAEITYAYAQQIPPDAVYSDWTPVTYLDIATRTE